MAWTDLTKQQKGQLLQDLQDLFIKEGNEDEFDFLKNHPVQICTFEWGEGFCWDGLGVLPKNITGDNQPLLIMDYAKDIDKWNKILTLDIQKVNEFVKGLQNILIKYSNGRYDNLKEHEVYVEVRREDGWSFFCIQWENWSHWNRKVETPTLSQIAIDFAKEIVSH